MVLGQLLTILVCLTLAYISAEFFRLFGLPRVVGQIFAGIFLSIISLYFNIFGTLGLDALNFLANLGIILLFYYVGLETNFSAFTKNMKTSLSVSLLNNLIPLFLGFSFMHFFLGYDILPSLIVGVCLSASAQSVSIDILEEVKKIKTKFGSLMISIGAVNDLVEIIFLTALLSIFHFTLNSPSFKFFLLDSLIFIFIIIVARIWFIPFTLKQFDKEKSSTTRFMGSIIIVLLIASLSEYFGFGVLIGAIIAGVIVRQTIFFEKDIPDWEEHDIARSIHIIAFGFLIPLFFVSVGLNTELFSIGADYFLIIIFIILAIFGTMISTVIGMRLNGHTFRQSILLGLGLTSKGDIELVIASLALNLGIISSNIFTGVVAMSLFTSISSPILFKYFISKHKLK